MAADQNEGVRQMEAVQVRCAKERDKGDYIPSGGQQANQSTYISPEEKTARVLHEAELAKGRILPTQGKNVNFVNTALLDKSYIVVAGHVDEGTVIKIQRGEYIDFGKLSPWDKIVAQEDQHLELVLRGGRSFYVPVNKTSRIGNYAKWEQAFWSTPIFTPEPSLTGPVS